MLHHYLVALRPKHWIKNSLVFVAPFFAGELMEAKVFWSAFVAFIAFSLTSSLGYLLNDWQDREIDKLHPKKKFRSFASERITGKQGILLSISLISVLVVIDMNMPIAFVMMQSGYLLTTMSYTLFLKKIPVLELIVLAFGFLLRALGGAAAVGLPVSNWFLTVLGFGSLCVGATKRYAEFNKSSEQEVRPVLREYTEHFLQSVTNVSMAISLMAYTLWVFQSQPGQIWTELSLVPITLCSFRFLWHRERGEAETPEELLFADPVLWISCISAITCLAIAIYIL
jgi:decaprenyl-phosphate phosphoribosyltransferase